MAVSGKEQEESPRKSLRDIDDLRLIGIDLRPFPDGATLAITPSGRMYRIESPPAAVEQLLQGYDGRPGIEKATAHPLSGQCGDVIQALLRDGCLRDAQPMSRERDWIRFDGKWLDATRIASTQLILIGDEPLLTVARDPRLTGCFGAVESATLDTLQCRLAKRPDSSIVVVALRTWLDCDFLLRLNDICETHRVRWTQFHTDQGRGWLGPSVVPGATANYRDLLGRRLAAAAEAHMFSALTSRPQGEPYVPPANELTWMLSFLFIDLERWIAGVPARTLSNEIEADPIALSFSTHSLFPLPDRQLCSEAPPNLKQEIRQLIDSRTGVILQLRKIQHHPSVPQALVSYQSRIAEMARLYPWGNDVFCAGSAFSDEEAARGAAIGEALERYCSNWVPALPLLRASYNQLKARGEDAIDPDSLVLYSENQYNTPGFPFVRFTRELQVHWVRGHSLTFDRRAWVPACVVYTNPYNGPCKGDAPTNHIFIPGIAAGPNLERAISSGVEEIIERHATMTWWLNRQPLSAAILPPQLRELWEANPTQLGQRAWIISLENEFDVPVVAGVLENVREKLFTIGFAARPDPYQAALKAWSEALTLQDGSRDLLDPQGGYRKAVKRGQYNGMFFKPWRADRRYLDEFRPDFRDVGDLMAQSQVFLDPRAREVVRPWTDTPETKRWHDIRSLKDRSLASYRKPVEDRGYEIFYVDVTLPDVAPTGVKVVRVVIPGLVANFAAAFPLLGQGAIQNAAVKLGWRAAPLREDELNYFPLPHT